MLQSKEHMLVNVLLFSVHPLVVFVVILLVHPLLVDCYLYFRHNNKQLINSLAMSIKAQGESTKSAPASSSHLPQLRGFCRAWLGYKSHLSYSWTAVCPPALSFSSSVSTLRDCGCAGAPQALSKALSGAQAPDCVFIIQQVEVAPQWGKSPVKNHSHGTVRESAAWCCSRLKGQTPLGGQVIERAHIQILKAAPNYQTHQRCRSNWNW